ncbi:hypothetical protein HII31_01424 [Pseudocercospora fuligena]|uniref:Uncharacterized protein n=1 Tax=Pseudocercospora fuligena TaxID=685502 RepID=A0A8H6VLM7_9PEZI|nr:hypothetical protein HII31_03798 [Pseudocercospora fuligena]KAF7196999.1 hypothetical protein HII31_01424 [Pseudocercospora fuligena]
MDAVAEQFILTKGVANCINLSLEHIQQSPLAEMLKRTTCPDGTTIHLPIRVASRLEAIWHMTATYELDEEARVDCHCAFMNVERLYKSMVYFCQRGTEIEISIFSEWQVAVSMGFIKLIQARHTLALVILAYYAASLTAIRTAWYTQNWAEFVLYEISQMLEDEMKQWIQWPMEQIQQRMSELLVQSPAHISTTT